MDVIGEPTYYDGLAIHILADTSQIVVELFFYRSVNRWLPMFGAEYDVYVVLNERLSHCISDNAPMGLIFFYVILRWAAPIVNGLRPFGAWYDVFNP